MSNVFIEKLTILSEPWVGMMWRACWQGAIALLLAWTICHVFGTRMPARLRPWLWRLACLKLLVSLLPVTPLTLPVLPDSNPVVSSPKTGQTKFRMLDDKTRFAEIDDRIVSSTRELIVSPRANAVVSDAEEYSAKESAGKAATSTPQRTFAGSSSSAMPRLEYRSETGAYRSETDAATVLPGAIDMWMTALFVAWLCGVGWQVVRLLGDWRRVQTLRRACSPIPDQTIQIMLQDLCRRLKVQRAPVVLQSSHCGPLLAGLICPAIVLPASLLKEYSADEVRLMLAHEAAHLKRHDLAWNLLKAVVGTLFWFHPLVWLARHEWHRATEEACDELAVSTASAPVAAYGAMLLRMATSYSAPRNSLLSTVSMVEEHAVLRHRLLALRRIGHDNERAFKIASVLLFATAAAGLVPWRMTARAQTPDTSPSLTPVTTKATSESTVLSGPGVVIHLEDKPVAVRKKMKIIRGYDTPGIVHDYDLLQVINELRAAKAQGFSINGVRLTNHTAIRARGPKIYVGGEAVQHPYKVEAVGDPDALEKSLSTPYGLINHFNNFGPTTRLVHAKQIYLAAAAPNTLDQGALGDRQESPQEQSPQKITAPDSALLLKTLSENRTEIKKIELRRALLLKTDDVTSNPMAKNSRLARLMQGWIRARQDRERVLVDLMRQRGANAADAQPSAVSVSGNRAFLIHSQFIDSTKSVVAVDKRISMTKDKEFQRVLTALGHVGRAEVMNLQDYHHAHLCPFCRKADGLKHGEWRVWFNGIQKTEGVRVTIKTKGTSVLTTAKGTTTIKTVDITVAGTPANLGVIFQAQSGKFQPAQKWVVGSTRRLMLTEPVIITVRLSGKQVLRIKAARADIEYEKSSVRAANGKADKFLKEAERASPVRAPTPSPDKRLRVVIDAGHGGYDIGAVSSNHDGLQLHEKDVTLSLALKLKAKLEQQGSQVVMTRTTDKFLSLQDRVRVVNTAKPDCFISLHVFDPRSGSGEAGRSYELFYHHQTSRPLANALNSKIFRKVGADSKASGGAIRQARFFVVRKVAVPATMIIGDFKTLTASQSHMADAITDGLMSFGKRPTQN